MGCGGPPLGRDGRGGADRRRRPGLTPRLLVRGGREVHRGHRRGAGQRDCAIVPRTCIGSAGPTRRSKGRSRRGSRYAARGPPRRRALRPRTDGDGRRSTARGGPSARAGASRMFMDDERRDRGPCPGPRMDGAGATGRGRRAGALGIALPASVARRRRFDWHRRATVYITAVTPRRRRRASPPPPSRSASRRAGRVCPCRGAAASRPR